MKTIQTAWFRDQLAARKVSQRGFAKMIGLDPAAVSLMFRGRRKITPDEVRKIASVLGVGVTEVMRRAGVEVTDDVRKVPISAKVAGNGVISPLPKSSGHVIGPADCPAGTYAVQCQDSRGLHDGWIMFVNPSQEEPAVSIDRLCVVTTDKDQSLLAVVRRGYRAGQWNLITWPDLETHTGAPVASCARVTWVKPGDL